MQTHFTDGNFSFQRLPSQRKRAIFPAFAVPTEMEEDAHEKHLRDFDLRAGGVWRSGSSATLQPGQEGSSQRAQDCPLRRSKMDANHKRLRRRIGYWRHERRRNAICTAPSL